MKRVNCFTFDDYVQINGFEGFVEFIGAEIIYLLTKADELIRVAINEIKEVFLIEGGVTESDCSVFYLNQLV